MGVHGGPLGKADAAMYYRLTMNILYLSKTEGTDIQIPVSFLATGVRSPDRHYWKKLGKILQYMVFTKDLPLTLEDSSVHVINWFVEAYFAVHGDMRIHTGGFMTLGKGCVYGTSVHQKFNTKSSTEADLVGVSDVLTQVIWTRYFLEDQG